MVISMKPRKRARKKARTRVWVFLIRKGGSAKTTSAVNYACALAYRYGRKVLLIDLDPQGNASSHVGINLGDTDLTVNTLFTKIGVDPHMIIRQVSFEINGKQIVLDVMPANRDLDDTDLSMKATQAGMFRPVIQAIEDDYDDIVIDTRPTRSLLTLSGMIPATDAIITMEAGVFALDGLKDTIQDIAEVRTGLNPDLHLVGILPTRVRDATNLSRAILGKAGKDHEHLLMRYADGNGESQLLYIRDSVKMGEAPVHGLPGIVYAPDNPASQDYLKLAEVLHGS